MDAAICAYIRKLTHTPTKITDDDIVALRSAGVDDRGIHDATQIIALFNYYPRIAEGLGIEDEPLDLVRPWGELGLTAERAPEPPDPAG